MSQIKIWGTGKPLTGFTQDDVLTNARKLFPKSKAQHIARFIAGKPFVITRVIDDSGAQKLIAGLATSGIEASTAGPPPSATPAEVAEAEAEEEVEEEQEPGEEIVPEEPPPLKPPVRRGNLKLILAAVVLLLVVAGGIAVFVQMQRSESRQQAEQAKAEARMLDSLAAKRKAEAEAQQLAQQAAADKAEAAAREALQLEKKEAAATEVNSAFAAGNYPQVIFLSERFEAMYGPDPRVQKLENDATFNLKEGARRGNFAAILDAPIKGSTRFAQLKDWAEQVQKRAQAK